MDALIEADFLLHRLQGDRLMTELLLKAFLTDFTRFVEDLRSPEINVSRVRHSLRGMCQDVGAFNVARHLADYPERLGLLSFLEQTQPLLNDDITRWMQQPSERFAGINR